MNPAILIPIVVEGVRFISTLGDDAGGVSDVPGMDDRDIFSYGSSHRDLIRADSRAMVAGLLVVYGEHYLRQLNRSGPVRGVLANEQVISGLALGAAASLFGPQKSYTAEDALNIYVRDLAQAIYDYDPSLIANVKAVSFDRRTIDLIDPVFDALGSKSPELTLSSGIMAALGVKSGTWSLLTEPGILTNPNLQRWQKTINVTKAQGSVSQTMRLPFLVLSVLEDIIAETPQYLPMTGFNYLLPSLALLPRVHAPVHSTIALVIPPPSASNLLTRSTDRRNAERWGYVPIMGSLSDYEHSSRVEIESVDPRHGVMYREKQSSSQRSDKSDSPTESVMRILDLATNLLRRTKPR